MDPKIVQDLDSKINLLKDINENQEFIKHLKDILEYHNGFDLAMAHKRIFKNILPHISNRFHRVYNDNISIFETLDDKIMPVLIKENLEIAFDLTETLQEILNYICQHNPVNAADIESVLTHVPNCVLIFTDHCKKSSDTYKNAFNAEISKLLEVTKHLYASFLHIVEFSVNIHKNNDESGVLVAALLLICELPKNLYNLDANSAIASWKCFSAVTAKYSSTLENYMDLRNPITALGEDIYKMLETQNHDMESFPRQIKIVNFLIRLLFKITDIFYQQLDTFALELLTFYVKVLSLSPDHFISQQLSADALIALDADVFKSLDAFLQRLVMGQSGFKGHLEKISIHMENMTVFKEHPLGVINLLCKILHMVAILGSNWCLITLKFIQVIFTTLPLCQYTALFMKGKNDSIIYQQLIINVSAAILFQDVRFQSADILLTHILQDNIFVAVLALEIYTVVVSNVHPDECITLFINLLYGVNDLQYGFFTSRPELIYLKKLLQRIFRILPNTLKDEVIKLFNPEQCIQTWSFLGFNSLPAHQVQVIINSVVNNTSESIRSIFESCSEDIPLNIAEGLDLLSTVDNLDINNPLFCEITKFLDLFWASDFSRDETLDNNIMIYFTMKISGITSNCMQNSVLDLQMVCTKLKTLSCKEAYWVSVYKIMHSILNSMQLINIPEINKQHVLTQIADIISLLLKNRSNLLLHETYLELFKNLNESQKDIVNYLLDSLNDNVANQIFQYLEKCSTPTPLLDDKHTKINFKHKCLNWNNYVHTSSIFPQVKRAKLEVQPSKSTVKTTNSKEKVLTNQVSKKTLKINTKNTEEQREVFTSHEAEDESSAVEVIARLKGEVKCLVKICKTEKLTQKNVADLRILMGQMSSLM